MTRLAFAALLGQAPAAQDSFPHPSLPGPAEWPGVMVIVILGLFATAIVLGPVVRAIHRDNDDDSRDTPPE